MTPLPVPAEPGGSAASKDVFGALGEPARRHILELLGDEDQPAGTVAAAMRARHGISQPATSQHLKVLREAGLVRVRPEGRQRIYAVDPAGIGAAMAWLAHFTDTFAQPLDALETELARGRRERRGAADEGPGRAADARKGASSSRTA